MMEISKKSGKVILIMMVLILTAAFNIYSESIWEGSAAMGRYGELPASGSYGASNSFSRNSFVEVENLENGKKTRLIVVDRLSEAGLLMLLSNQAAQELGIFQNTIARIKVRLISSSNSEKSITRDGHAYSQDPDINPASAFGRGDDAVFEPAATAGVEPEAVEEVAAAPEAVEPDAGIEPNYLTDMPPETEGLKEAESLDSEETVPASVSEIPDKPFDWPPGEVEEEPEEEPEPVSLSMDSLKESSPGEDGDAPSGTMPDPEARSLWPEGESAEIAEEAEPAEEDPSLEGDLAAALPLDSAAELDGSGLDVPESNLELLSSGLDETLPVYESEYELSISTLPEIVREEDDEYITDATGYYSPRSVEDTIESDSLPAPEPEISEEVIAALVGDSADIAEAYPEAEAVGENYLVPPEVIKTEDMTSDTIYTELAEARPIEEDEFDITISDSPLPPGVEDRSLVEVANGYVSPEKPDFTGDIRDYPKLVEGEVDDEEPASEDLETIIPEYDENIEVALEPAEVRPPVLVEEDTALSGAEPEEEIPEAAAAGHVPDADALAAVAEETEPAVVAAVAEVEAVKQPEPLTAVPAKVVMATKLQQQRHYLQLGAFREKNSAIFAAGRLEEGYPVTILSDEAGETASYKLLLGPLSSDESGILLYNFRAGGYSDAFIRRIE